MIRHHGYVTMEKIDAARSVATATVAHYQIALANASSAEALRALEKLREDLSFKRDIVEALLRQWWRQGCKEVR